MCNPSACHWQYNKPTAVVSFPEALILRNEGPESCILPGCGKFSQEGWKLVVAVGGSCGDSNIWDDLPHFWDQGSNRADLKLTNQEVLVGMTGSCVDFVRRR